MAGAATFHDRSRATPSMVSARAPFFHNTASFIQQAAKMPPLPSAASSAVRSWTRHALPNTTRLAAPSVTAVAPSSRRSVTNATSEPTSFNSPFGTGADASSAGAKIPSFKNYMSGRGENTNRVFQYFMVGSMGLLAAAGAKATVQGMPLELGSQRSWARTA